VAFRYTGNALRGVPIGNGGRGDAIPSNGRRRVNRLSAARHRGRALQDDVMTQTLQGRTNKRWRFIPHDGQRIAKLEQAAGISPIVAQLLISRGVYEAEQARTFLDAKLTGLRDPDLLPGASEAADRIYAAVQARRKIVIYGDYDADGMTGTAILLSCLRLLGAEVSSHVPNRLEDGYGLIKKVRALAKEHGGQTPALALTAYARTEDRVRALSEGYHAHLAKPVDRLELAAVVAGLVHR